MKTFISCLSFLCLVILTSCRSSTPDKLYILMPDETLKPRENNVSIYLGNVTIPSFLNRKELIRLIDNEQIATIPNCYWAASLDKAIRDTLEQNLAILLGQNAVATHKSTSTITIDLIFRHFEITHENQLHVRLLLAPTGRSVVPVSFDIPLTDYPSIVTAHNAALSRIAKTIAEAL